MIWSINGGTPDSVDMTNTSGSTYEATIPAQAYNTHIDYTIKAIDNSSAHNVATLSKWFFTKRLLVQDITIGTGTSTTYYLPLRGNYDYSYGGMIYASNEINYSGPIRKIKFYVGNTPNNYTTDNQIIYMGEVPYTTFSSTSLIDTVGLTRVKEPFSYTWNGGGWKEFELDVPFDYSGNNSLLIVWVNRDGSGVTGYPTFRYTSKTNGGIYKYQNSTYPSIPGTGTRTSSRPNIQLTFEIPSLNNDVQFISITEPSGILYSTNQYDLKGNFKNLGNDTLTSFTIKYKINGVEQTPYNWTGTMLTDEVREITFATGLSFSAGPVVIEAWTENPNGVADEDQSNDTANVSLNCCTAGFSGTYTIDSSQPTGGTNFNNVGDAFTEIGTCGIIGPVTIELVDTLYQGSIILGELPGLSPTNTLTIKPQNGKQVTIESDATYYTIQLLATHDIIIDGSGDGSGSRDLTIKHTATSGSHTPIHIASSGVGQGSKRITIKNVNIEAGRNGSTTSGIFIGGSTSATASGADNDSIIIDNVNIQKSYYGIYSYGTSANPANRIYITNSSFGSDSTDNFITQRGVYLYYANNILVNYNHIYNLTTSSSTPQGIYLYHSDTATVMNNIIHSVKYTGTSGYGGHGIESYYSNNALIANNMIYDMQGDGYTSITGSSMAGIVIRYSNENKVYFNSVNLFGDYTRSNATITSAFFADANSSELDVRNNIFANSMMNTDNAGAKSYAIYSLAAPSAYTFLDYNDYYVSGLQGVLGYFNSTDQTTLASLRAATGKDVHSINVDPEFTSNTDLHTSNSDLSSMGTPIPDIDTDIDGDPRYPIPSIGADEVELLPINLKLASIDNTIHGCEYSGNTPVKFTVINMGTDPISSFDATYILDGGTPVTQSFTTNLNSFDAAQFTFSTNITIDPTIEHSLRVYVSCDGDGNRNNDTLDIRISDVYNLVVSPYTMSFELTEPYGYFSALDIGNDGYSWVFPAAGDAHSGNYSAVYNNSTTNSHGDWLFSRCFELTAGETYEVSFWYKASTAADNHVMYLGISPTPEDTINLVNIDNISAINNTTYTQHTKRFIAPTTGTYYIGWGMYGPHANNKLYLDDINISWVPAQDAKMVEVTAPVTDCGLAVEHIAVKGVNNGVNPISNFPISYQIAGNLNVVTETYTGTVAPLDT
ncbi:MAG: right-handed parallel beta-helix repeat-containing protein, partial [Bacteroidales bacterium]|nr:right-handed parallel beta-helix repeat-containing protein [Bacteroidales bacterium]